MTVTLEDEYRALHGDAVWVDRSARDSRLEVRGPDAADWLQGLLTQEVKSLEPGQGAYAAYLTPQGRIVFDVGPDPIQVCIIANDMLVVVPLPDMPVERRPPRSAHSVDVPVRRAAEARP